MADRPILFSASMVKALLAGTKSQTRRLSGLADVNERPSAWTLHSVGPLGYMTKPSARGKFGATFESREIELRTLTVCPQRLPYAVGDRLWVREAWCLNGLVSGGSERSPVGCLFRADGAHVIDDDGDGFALLNKDGSERSPWRPSIHMPRWASRLTLTVTDVRVQRLGEISCADAIAEGIPAAANSQTIDCDTPDPRLAYRRLWESLHGAGSWEANPWVSVITFRTKLGNIDA